ncbi:hypothetical protein BOX15_Mlig018104g2, partial [Macrostomum lignano]
PVPEAAHQLVHTNKNLQRLHTSVSMETDAYKATTTETTATHSEGPGVGLDKDFVRTPLGIVLIAAFVSAVILFICGTVFPWSAHGGGFVAFVGTTAAFGTGILFVLYLIRLLPKIPGPFGLVILIYLAVVVILSLIAFILSAVNGKGIGSAAIASAVFAVPTLGLHGYIGFLMFRKYQVLKNHFHKGECGHSYSVTTTQQNYEASHPEDAAPAYGNY